MVWLRARVRVRGCTGNDFEGGVRTASFVSGGLVPPAMRGSTLDGYIHVADWCGSREQGLGRGVARPLVSCSELVAACLAGCRYATIASLAGADPHDAPAGVPASDALDMSPMLMGINTTSPRTEIPLHYTQTPTALNAALIQGRYKIVLGNQSHTGMMR